MFICYLLALLTSTPSCEEVFTHIYQDKIWGRNINGEGTSGDGSTLEHTYIYRQFLQKFLKTYGIHSVVDVGCGDWEFSKTINWKGIQYIGYDVVASVIAKNQANYASSNIQFILENALHIDLPGADLLICKDVLQHLTNEDIMTFITQLSKFKYCLITNDVNPNTLTSDNPDITRGDKRDLDLTKPPFSLDGIKVMRFNSGPEIKQVLLICPR